MSIRRLILFIAAVAVIGSLVLIGINRSSAHNSKQAKRVPLTVLESSGVPIISSGSKKTSLAPSKDGQTVYSLDSMTGELFVYDRNSRRLKKAEVSFANVEAFAVGPQGDLYLAQSDSTVQIMNSQGRRLNRFPTVYPRSIAVLSNGNVVIASHSNGKVLHLYSGQGVLLNSFGEPKTFVSDYAENEFLNLGKVIAGSGDQIYYVSTYAVEPYVLRFSSEGKLLGEFQIEGDAVDFQTDLTRDFLTRRRSDQNGGVTIITSATVNPYTGHLWLSMNGLSTTGTVYEYDQTGTKLREYAFLLKTNDKRHNVTHVKDIAVSSDSLDVLTWGGTYSLKFSDMVLADAYAAARKNPRSQKSTWRTWANPFSRIREYWAEAPAPAIPQTPCGQAQPTTCVANCPAGSNPINVNCGAEINSLLADRIPTQVACTLKTIDATPGASNPGGCSETVQWCNSSNGATGSVTVNINCNAVPTSTPTPTPLPEPTVEPTPTPTPGECTEEQGITCGSMGMLLGHYPQCNCVEFRQGDPVIVDVLGDGFNLTSFADGVNFDIDADGTKEHLAWTALGADDSFLVLDRNGNGTIDNGAELFGDVTPQPISSLPHGFIALAEYDKPEKGGNADGLITRGDAVFSQLRLWQDSNHNGVSEPTELHTLRQLGLNMIDCDYRRAGRRDEHGNVFRYRAKVKDTHDAQVGRWAWDIFLVAEP